MRAAFVGGLLVLVACEAAPSDPDAGTRDSGTDGLADVGSPEDSGPPGDPVIAVAHFASSTELATVDVCAVPTGGGTPIRVSSDLGLSAISIGTVTNPIIIAPGSYTFTAIEAGTTDCTDALRGFTLPIMAGADWILLVAGGIGPGEAAPVLGRIDRSRRTSPSMARIRAVQLARDTSGGAGGFSTDLSLDLGAAEILVGMGAGFGSTGAAPSGDSLGYTDVDPATGVQLVVRFMGMPEEVGRSQTFTLEAGHTYTAYVYGYAFMGAGAIDYLICDDSLEGSGGIADCQ